MLSIMVAVISMRIYIETVQEYRSLLQFLKHTDYGYHAFEVLKIDLHSDTEAVALTENELKIVKSSYITGNKITLTQRGDRLLYVFEGGQVQDLCRGLTAVKMRRIGDILFIELAFPDVSYERGFYIGK